ncbi:ABC transporter permease [Zhaonella formicivorans]|uniref:ABC transporter permease n=1 Tax=Zhaonella formicivorans TaxID=2528593 RepID=UPI0010F1355A|nr:ABC transporter permease [Zhaonella formicivorans]
MRYILQNPGNVLSLTLAHIEISAVAVLASVLIGVPIGIILTRVKFLKGFVIGVAGVLYTIPSLALFAFLIPFFGLGFKPTIIALILYSQLAIIRNTASGIESIEPNIIEAATGMGMNRRELLFLVQLPLGLPVIMAGVRMITVMSIGIATIAAYIGAGGLGDLIFQGMFTVDADLIVAGAIPICLLALLSDYLLIKLQHKMEQWKHDFNLSSENLAAKGGKL